MALNPAPYITNKQVEMDCLVKRTVRILYDNGITPGSSSNTGGTRSNLVRFNWTFESLGWETDKGLLGVGDTIGSYGGWSPQLEGWVAFGQTHYPDQTNHTFDFLPAPTWRSWNVVTCNPNAQFGKWELQRLDGNGGTYTIYPLLSEIIYDVCYRKEICDEKGKVIEIKWFRAIDEDTFEAIETPVDSDCYVSKEFEFPDPILEGAESPCTQTKHYLCDIANNDAQIILFIDDCPGQPRFRTAYLLDDYNNADSPDIPEYDITDAELVLLDPTTGTKGSSFEEPDVVCEDFVVPVCVESQEWTYGLDNAGTRFNDNATYELELSDGTTLNWVQTAQTGWSNQLTQWAANIQTAADNAGLVWFVEPRFIDNSNVTNLDGTINGPGGTPSGLPGAPSEIVAQALFDGGMFWRYVNFQICPGQPVPVAATRIESDIYGADGYNLTAAGPVLGPVQKFEICKTCFICDPPVIETTWFIYKNGKPVLASDGEIPNCWEPCGVLSTLPPPPNQACQFEFSEACDNNNSDLTADFTNLVTRRTTICNGEKIAVDYFIPDANDPSALVEYTLAGQYVDCDTGLEIPIPPPECGDFEITTLWTIENKTPGIRNREWTNLGPANSFTSDSSEPENYIDSFDFSVIPDINTIVTSNVFILNDTSNVASVLDYQRKDGFICVEKPIEIEFGTNSEGYIGFWIGLCGKEQERVISYAKAVGLERTPRYVIPPGIHSVRLDNLDWGGTNSNWTLYEVNGDTSTINNSLFDDLSSTTIPHEICKKVKVCKDNGILIDLFTNEIVDPDGCRSCPLPTCSSSGDMSAANINALACAIAEKLMVTKPDIFDFTVEFKSSGITSILSDKGEAITNGPYDFINLNAGQNASNATDIAAAQADIQSFLDDNGGGTVTLEYLSESILTITITGTTCTFTTANDDSNLGPHEFTKTESL